MFGNKTFFDYILKNDKWRKPDFEYGFEVGWFWSVFIQVCYVNQKFHFLFCFYKKQIQTVQKGK